MLLIGDAAFFASTSARDELGVQVGDRYYVVDFEPAGTADARTKLVALTKQALNRR